MGLPTVIIQPVYTKHLLCMGYNRGHTPWHRHNSIETFLWKENTESPFIMSLKHFFFPPSKYCLQYCNLYSPVIQNSSPIQANWMSGSLSSFMENKYTISARFLSFWDLFKKTHHYICYSKVQGYEDGKC